MPREAGLRRQSRHPCKANTERRSGRGTRVSGVIPSRFCCPAAIKYPAGAVSSLPVESLAVVPPAATGGGGNGSGTKRRLVLAVGFQGGYPLVALWLLSGNSESSICEPTPRAEQKQNEARRCRNQKPCAAANRKAFRGAAQQKKGGAKKLHKIPKALYFERQIMVYCL